jgi:hypothetical protein
VHPACPQSRCALSSAKVPFVFSVFVGVSFMAIKEKFFPSGFPPVVFRFPCRPRFSLFSGFGRPVVGEAERRRPV